MCEYQRIKLTHDNCEDYPSKIQVHIWERIWHRFRNTSPYTHDRVVDEIIKSWGKKKRNNKYCSEKRVNFFLRVDDFPRWDLPLKTFLTFDAILAKFGIEYCLGVTPRIPRDPLNPSSECDSGLSDEATAILKNISERVDIALHGLTHRVQSYQIRSEFKDLNPTIIEKYIINGLNLLKIIDIRPVSFIPPFNSISVSALPVLTRYFRFLFGGPESVATLGFHISPSFLSGMIYLPSYPPAYGRAKEMYDFVKRLKQIHLPIIIPLTIHWAWEERDNFHAFEMLCKELVGWTISITKASSIGADSADSLFEKNRY